MTEELYRGDTPEEIEAHKVFEGQLKLVREMITEEIEGDPGDGEARGPHWHFTDDCGEYLRGALDLAGAMASAREDGTASLLEMLKELAQLTTDEWEDWEVEYKVYDDYPTDSVCGEFIEWARALNTTKEGRMRKGKEKDAQGS